MSDTIPTVRDEWGLACPACGSDEQLQVALLTMADVTPDGTVPWGDHEWDSKSFMRCSGCKHAGRVRDFYTDDEDGTSAALQQQEGDNSHA